MNRREVLGGLAALAASGIGGGAFARRRSDDDVLRVGVMTNLTHAPMLAGLGSGRIAAAMHPTRIDIKAFRSGPRVSEALLGGAIDAGTAGPAAIVIHHARHARRGGGLRVLGGCASGGASFMVAKGSGIRDADGLRGKRLAVTQIGTTQDVALRAHLARHGLADAVTGGDVTVIAVAASVVLEQMRRGDVHGAWLAEPWATRLEHEIDAVRQIDERNLWPGRAFATAALVVRAGSARDPRAARLVAALNEEVARAQTDPNRTLDDAYAEMKRHVGNPGARSVFDAAASFVDFTTDTFRSSFERFAKDAEAVGYLPRESDWRGLFG